MSILEHFRKHQARLGGAVLALFVAAFFSLLVQPCLMAASVDDCHSAASHQLSVTPCPTAEHSPDVVSPNPGNGFGPGVSASCESMANCTDCAGLRPVISNPDLEKKFLVWTLQSAYVRPESVATYLPTIGREFVPSRVPLFIQNCAFLI